MRIDPVRVVPDLQILPTLQKMYSAGAIVGPHGGVAIAGQSEIDRCWVFPKGDGPAVEGRAFTGITHHQHNLFERGILVSAKRPFIGEIEGPYSILLPYAPAVYHHSSTSHERATILRASNYGQSGALPSLDLEFFRCVPSWLPSQRAPREYVYRSDDFGTGTGDSSKTFRVPAFGRRYISIALDAIVLGGTINLTIKGIKGCDWTSVTIDARETLLATESLTTDTARIYEFTGEFDFVEVTLAEGSALSADSAVGLIITVMDS